MDISEITVQILDLINQINETVKFHITIQWAAIGFAATVLSITFVSVTNSRVKSGIIKGVEDAKKYYIERLDDLESTIGKRVKELERHIEQIELENEQGTYAIKVLQNNKVLSEQINHYYRLRDMVVLDINIMIDDYAKSDDLVVLRGLPFPPSEESESIMSIINSETGMKLSNVTIKIQENTTRIRLLVSWENHATRELRYSDIEPKSKITGKIIYLIN